MTTLRSSQLTTIAVIANGAGFLQVSQLVTVAVIANGKHFQTLGPVIGLGCWTPCGTLAYNGE